MGRQIRADLPALREARICSLPAQMAALSHSQYAKTGNREDPHHASWQIIGIAGDLVGRSPLVSAAKSSADPVPFGSCRGRRASSLPEAHADSPASFLEPPCLRRHLMRCLPHRHGLEHSLSFGPSHAGQLGSLPADCRVGGGALDCSCAGLRPPHKLDVQFSRIQLS